MLVAYVIKYFVRSGWSIYIQSGHFLYWYKYADSHALANLICFYLSWYSGIHQSNWSSVMTSLRKHAYLNILKILPPKTENFQIKNSDLFQISAQNSDCRYSLEPPRRRGGSSEYPQSMFWADIRKLMYTLVNPKFIYACFLAMFWNDDNTHTDRHFLLKGIY